VAVNAELPDAFPPALPLTGEGAPALLTVLLAAMGATLAVVSASLWLAPVNLQEPVTIVVHEKEPAPPPQIIEVQLPAPEPKIIEVPAPPPPPPCFDPVTIMFATNKSDPLVATDTERALLRAGVARISDWLSKHTDAKLLIEGHADSQGTEERNLVLSFARAKAVSSLLATNGIAPNRQTVRAAGAGEAAIKIDRRDRRVDAGIEGVSPCKGASGATEHP
jgi:outer membrane protein OmpA-like peptidoglycan-associated protein